MNNKTDRKHKKRAAAKLIAAASSLSQKLFYFLGKPHLAWVSLFEVYRLQIHPSCAFERPEISHTAVCDQRLLALGTIGLFLKKETQKLLIGFIYKLKAAAKLIAAASVNCSLVVRFKACVRLVETFEPVESSTFTCCIVR